MLLTFNSYGGRQPHAFVRVNAGHPSHKLIYSNQPGAKALSNKQRWQNKTKDWTVNRSVSSATANRVDQQLIEKSNGLGSAEYIKVGKCPPT